MLGCVHATYTRIIRPQKYEEAFFNRQGYHFDAIGQRLAAFTFSEGFLLGDSGYHLYSIPAETSFQS